MSRANPPAMHAFRASEPGGDQASQYIRNRGRMSSSASRRRAYGHHQTHRDPGRHAGGHQEAPAQARPHRQLSPDRRHVRGSAGHRHSEWGSDPNAGAAGARQLYRGVLQPQDQPELARNSPERRRTAAMHSRYDDDVIYLLVTASSLLYAIREVIEYNDDEDLRRHMPGQRHAQRMFDEQERLKREEIK